MIKIIFVFTNNNYIMKKNIKTFDYFWKYDLLLTNQINRRLNISTNNLIVLKNKYKNVEKVNIFNLFQCHN